MNNLRLLGFLALAPALCPAQVSGTGGVLLLEAQPWSMDHANPARTGATMSRGPAVGAIDWSRKIGGIPLGISCDRAGRAILGATFYDAWWSGDLYVQAYERDGSISWRQKVAPYDWGASQGVRSKPALNKLGEAVVNSGNGQLVKFNVAGDLLLTIQGNGSATNDSGPAVLKDGSIVHYQFINVTKYTTAGALVWSQQAFSQSDPAVAPNNDVAIGGVRSNEPHGAPDVTYLNANGTLRWSKTSTYGTNTQVCFGLDGTLYTTVAGVTAYNPDGTTKWTAPNGGWGVCLDHSGRALVPQGNRIYAYNKDTGAPVWTAILPVGGSIVQGLTIDGADKIYVSTADGYVVCVNKDGTNSWSLKVADQLYTQPSISIGSTLYVTGRVSFSDYFLYRIK